jgi:hypothetical protein
MWVHKSAEELVREHKRLWIRLGGPLTLFFLALTVVITLGLTGPVSPISGARWHSPSSFGDLLSRSFEVALVSFIVAYGWQMLAGKPFLELMHPSRMAICTKCFRAQWFSGRRSCECGGDLEDFSLWKWVDDESEEGELKRELKQ